MYACKFRVIGKGHFPMDMLRYDQCFPRTTDDAIALVPSDHPADHVFAQANTREIELIKLANTKHGAMPTNARWASFGWRVMRVESNRFV